MIKNNSFATVYFIDKEGKEFSFFFYPVAEIRTQERLDKIIKGFCLEKEKEGLSLLNYSTNKEREESNARF